MPEFQPYRSDPVDHSDPLARAMHDVAIPDGLQARLLERLNESRELSTTGLIMPRARTDGARSRMSRRAWVGGATAAGFGGVLGGYVWLRRELEMDEVVALAMTWLDRKWAWRPMPAGETAASFGKLPRILRVPAHGWEQFASKLSYHTVVYNVSTPVPGETGTNAVLFEIDTWRSMSAIPAAAPRIVTPTGGWQFAVWRSSGYLYVLAWTGPAPARRIRTLLNSQEPAPLA